MAVGDMKNPPSQPHAAAQATTAAIDLRFIVHLAILTILFARQA
jgi:hypothetical protein